MIIPVRAMTIAGMAFIGGLAAVDAQASAVGYMLPTPLVVNNAFVGFVGIDVDNDGYDDVHIEHISDRYPDDPVDTKTDAFVYIYSTYGTASEVTSGDYGDTFASAFTAGNLIDASLNYDCGCGAVAAFNYYDADPTSPTFEKRSGNYGYWANGGLGTWPGAGQGHQGYIGFAFDFADGSIHYGWMQIGVKAYDENDPSSYEVSIYGYGYETSEETGINAGDLPVPGPLPLLALGSVGYVVRKRRA